MGKTLNFTAPPVLVLATRMARPSKSIKQ